MRLWFKSYAFFWIVITVLTMSMVDTSLAISQRARYLLGIAYNDGFKNCADVNVYGDYVARHFWDDSLEKQFKPQVRACQ